MPPSAAPTHEAERAPGCREQGGPDDEDRGPNHEQPLDAQPAREPPVREHRRDLQHRVGRPADADEPGVAAELDEPQAEERHDPGRGDPDDDRAREEQPHRRVAQEPERPDRADPGGARRPRSPAQDGRADDAGERQGRDVHGEHRRRAGRLDEHPDAERRQDEPQRAEGTRLAEPVPGSPEPLHGPGVDERGQARRIRRRGSPRRSRSTASGARARGARRRPRPTAPRRGAAARTSPRRSATRPHDGAPMIATAAGTDAEQADDREPDAKVLEQHRRIGGPAADGAEQEHVDDGRPGQRAADLGGGGVARGRHGNQCAGGDGRRAAAARERSRRTPPRRPPRGSGPA